MEELIKEFVQICTEKKLKTYKQVRKTIFEEIWKDYKNKGAQKWRVEAVSDDLAESVVLRMGIPHEA